MSPTENDQVFANVVMFLLHGEEKEAANLLLSCDFQCVSNGNEKKEGWDVYLTGPRSIVEVFDNNNDFDQLPRAIYGAINTVVEAHGVVLNGFHPTLKLVQFDADWRTQATGTISGANVSNQLADSATTGTAVEWKNLRFRSVTERRIAQALEEAQVLFLPNCKARLNGEDARENREPDFLICHNGKWGVLEVDGEPYHPPSRTVHDHSRDRLFRAHGIPVVEHFDAGECYKNPRAVVRKFLEILSHA